MIGYSLSNCIKDILEGRVEISRVEKIISGTCASNEDKWNRLVKVHYGPTYWSSNPQRATEIMLQLRDEGKIEQPRIDNPGYERNISRGWWEIDGTRHHWLGTGYVLKPTYRNGYDLVEADGMWEAWDGVNRIFEKVSPQFEELTDLLEWIDAHPIQELADHPEMM